MRASTLATVLGAAVVSTAVALTYNVQILEKAPVPAISIKKPVGQGNSPCQFTFNPAFIPGDAPGMNGTSMLIFRASGCPASYGGGSDHLMWAYCNTDGTCGDVQPGNGFPFEGTAEDPRVFIYDGYVWLYYFAAGAGQNTVYLRRTQTPLDLSSWEEVASALPWHRNGCVIVRPDGNHYVFFGESPPLPGLGVAQTSDFKAYDYLNLRWMTPNGANNTLAPEIVIEAGSTPVQLSTGDYLHLYAAGTPGWVANGNYTGGWVIMDAADPTQIVAKGAQHLFVPTMDYEIGNGIWPVNRNRTIFTTSVIPIAGQVDTFRVWYGAADANIAWAVIQVTHS